MGRHGPNSDLAVQWVLYKDKMDKAFPTENRDSGEPVEDDDKDAVHSY